LAPRRAHLAKPRVRSLMRLVHLASSQPFPKQRFGRGESRSLPGILSAKLPTLLAPLLPLLDSYAIVASRRFPSWSATPPPYVED